MLSIFHVNYNHQIKSYYLSGVKYYSTLTDLQEKKLLALIKQDRTSVLIKIIELNKSHHQKIDDELYALYMLAYTDYYKKLAHGTHNKLTLADYNEVFDQALVAFIVTQKLIYFI